MRKKRSFFEKLTGAVRVDDFDEEYMEDEDHHSLSQEEPHPEKDIEHTDSHVEENVHSDEGQLSVDVMNTPNEIIVKSMVAGVKPADLDINISRDMVTIHGTRHEEADTRQEDYFHRELYWGAFSRNIILPEEVDVDLAEAKEKHGLLVIRLPKLDKSRKTKLSVKSG
jgi:HSP20 family protein